jgi:hypothetical protein
MYIDESYESKSKYIVLAGFILPEEKWSLLNEDIKNLKRNFFGKENINLKEIRRKNYDKEKKYKSLDKEKKAEFNEQFYKIVSRDDYTFIAALIDREKMDSKNKKFLFQLAYSFLIQRFQFFLQETKSRGMLIMDYSKNPEIKNLSEYHQICLDKGVPIGYQIRELKIGDEITKLKVYDYMDLKSIVEHLLFLDDSCSNHLQVVDMICSAISYNYNRNNDYFYKKIEKNIRRCGETGQIDGYGIKIFPQ